MVAFAWMCWVMTFALLIVNILFAVANSAFFRPLHGRYDPHASYYNAREYQPSDGDKTRLLTELVHSEQEPSLSVVAGACAERRHDTIDDDR